MSNQKQNESGYYGLYIAAATEKNREIRSALISRLTNYFIRLYLDGKISETEKNKKIDLLNNCKNTQEIMQLAEEYNLSDQDFRNFFRKD